MEKQENSTYITLDPELAVECDIGLQKPLLYHVILLNDDFTPIDFVIQLLTELFSKTYQEAYDITMQVHHFEKGIAGTYSYEIASEKSLQAKNLAEMNEFPLQCKVEQQ